MIWAPGTGLGAERGYVIEVLVALENTTAMTPMTSYSSVNADNIVKKISLFFGRRVMELRHRRPKNSCPRSIKGEKFGALISITTFVSFH